LGDFDWTETMLCEAASTGTSIIRRAAIGKQARPLQRIEEKDYCPVEVPF